MRIHNASVELLCKHITLRYMCDSDTDTANMQMKTLTQGLGMYRIKRQLMNTQN